MGDGAGFGAEDAPTLEATAVLAALASVTERVRLGPLVLGATYRHPAVVAKWASTVDLLSGGRLVLGLGAGWQVNEHEQYGIELGPPGQRIDRFDEALTVITSLLREARTTFHGVHYRLDRALCEPKPLQRPLPVLVGGKGDRMLGLVARHADEWNMWGLPDVIADRSSVLDARCEAVGRDPRSIRRSTQALLLPTDDAARAAAFREAVAPRAAVAGGVEEIVDVVGRWRDVGIDEVVVPDSTLGRGSERLEHLDRLLEAFAPFR
jgi:alkanesulfonate monooxygenase SsuD/methylene tetrahydromethanopterin reductase-like flavin-dependent oxidoreductase (luciferase family)